MTSDLIEIVLAVLVLVLGAGLEELLPKALGVGFPILLTAVQFAASRRGLLPAVLFAIAAGAMEDAISSLAPMTSVSYFLIVAVLARLSDMPRMLTAVTYPCYQVWLAVWTVGMGGGIFNRILLSFPIGLLTAFAVEVILTWASRKAAIDERE